MDVMQPVGRAVFGVFAFLPLLGVLGLSGYLSANVFERMARDPERYLQSTEGRATLLTVLVSCVAIALLQIALGIVVAIHTSKRRDLGGGEKAGWTLACLFVGSIALPLFFLLKSKPPA